jgi:hypothetical protein
MGDLTDLKRSNQLKGLGCLPPDAGSMSITCLVKKPTAMVAT